MKFSDIKYYLDKECLALNQIKFITLDKKLFWDFAEEVCESYFEVYDEFTDNGIKFKLRNDNSYGKYYMIVFLKDRSMGLGYYVLPENERIIKELLE